MLQVTGCLELGALRFLRVQVSEQENVKGGTLTLPILPLSNVVLFPKIHLPIRVFEPRLRSMVTDAIATQRLIGIALLRGGWESRFNGKSNFYSLGCAGEIVSASPFPDGRCRIVLHGFREFQIEEYFSETSSGRAKVVLREELQGNTRRLSTSLKQEILTTLEQMAGEKERDLLQTLKASALDAERWMNLCCFSLSISGLEKLSLLEARSVEERGRCLINILHFKAVQKGQPFDHLQALIRKNDPN